jgi:hypothetical protein
MWYMRGWGSILLIGCSRHVVEAVLCARVGVTDEWSHTAAHRQLERARGVRAGAVGSGRGNQPGGGGPHNLDGSAGAVCVRGCAGGTVHACVACGVRWDGTRLSVWASSGGVCGVHVGMGQRRDHRLQQTCGRV